MGARTGAAAAGLAMLAMTAAAAADPEGRKTIILHTADGGRVPVGSVTFTPQGEHTAFTVEKDTSRLTDFFLSMREFKCLEGDPVQCMVPYPYGTPGTVTGNDYTWLEHELLFLVKAPGEYGADMRNGIYYELAMEDGRLVGRPKAVDLNEIAAPPEDPAVPPFGPDQRAETLPRVLVEKLTIE